MSFLLYQDTYAACARQVPRVTARLAQNLGSVLVSAVTITLLEMWLVRSRTPTRYLQAYGTLMRQITVLSIDDAVAHRAASVGSRLYRQKVRMPLAPLLAAATALERGLTLVTHDTQLFSVVP